VIKINNATVKATETGNDRKWDIPIENIIFDSERSPSPEPASARIEAAPSKDHVCSICSEAIPAYWQVHPGCAAEYCFESEQATSNLQMKI
jgi:hypothetical protein